MEVTSVLEEDRCLLVPGGVRAYNSQSNSRAETGTSCTHTAQTCVKMCGANGDQKAVGLCSCQVVEQRVQECLVCRCWTQLGRKMKKKKKKNTKAVKITKHDKK